MVTEDDMTVTNPTEAPDIVTANDRGETMTRKKATGRRTMINQQIQTKTWTVHWFQNTHQIRNTYQLH